MFTTRTLVPVCIRPHGSEVLNVIRKFSDETMGILVQTNKNKTYYNYNFDIDKGELGKALDNKMCIRDR